MFRDVFLSDISRRQMEPEVMDDPALQRERHHEALRGLATINVLSLSAAHLWRPILRLARGRQQPLRVLDVATGGGDIPIALWQRAERAGVKLQVTGIDISRRAIEFARQRAEAGGADVTFEQCDVFAGGLPAGYDVIAASLFLHHLRNEQAVNLLTMMARRAGQAVLISDLRRHRAHLTLAHLASRLFTRSDVVRIDGPLSVKAAFTSAEARQLLEQANMQQATISRRWPCRFLVEWRKPAR